MTTKAKKKPPGSKATREKVLRCVLEGDSVPQIVQRLGLSKTQVRAYMDAPGFAEEVERLRANRREALMNRLEYAGQVAIASLVRQASAGTASNPKQGDRGAVMAADSILDRIGLHRTLATKTEAKTSSINTNVVVTDEDFAGRSEQELSFYAANGYWPEEAP